MRVAELPTPALVVDIASLEHNLATMAAALPAGRLRPHVKAHKCSEIARRQHAHGHPGMTCATPSEVVGLARAGFDDLLLANECLDAQRIRAMSSCGARVCVAVDSDATIEAVAANGIAEVLIDVNVGLPRCGCHPGDAGRLADHARARGLTVRGVMGYEGHVVGHPDRAAREQQTEHAMKLLVEAHADVGGDVVSAGGTGTYDINTWATEIQAGSYALMDTAYAQLALPFRPALHLVATVVSVSAKYAVADCGLKALGMDHGNPVIDGAEVWFCSDEHVTFAPAAPLRPGDRVLVQPAHVDPTVAYHEMFHAADGARADALVIDTWPVDLRGWNA